MKLFTYFRSSTAFRLRIALAYKGLDYTPAYVNLLAAQQREAGYVALNPQGLLPALVDDDGQVFTQSMAMIEWLDEKYPEPPLMPADADERWYVRAVAQVFGCDIHPLNNIRVLKYLKNELGADEAARQQWYEHWIAEGLAGLEGLLARQRRHGRFCLGDRFSMADICLVPQVYNARRFNCDLGAYPILRAIAANCDALPCVISSEPGAQPDRT